MQVQLEQTERGAVLVIPDALMRQAQMEAQATVDVSADGGRIVVSPGVVSPRRSRYAIEELLDSITPETLPPHADWGPPVGKEAW